MPMKLDKIDHKLILDLQKNGRCSYMQLAKMIGVAEGTIRNRLRKLMVGGVIKVTAIPELSSLGYSFIGIMGMQIRLADLHQVAEQLSQNPHVCYVANVTGGYDLIAIVVTKSPGEFAYFMEHVVSAIPSILRTETFVTLKNYKGSGGGLDTTQLISNLDIPTS